MNCPYCEQNGSGEVPAVILAPQQHDTYQVVYIPICRNHAEGWTEESDPDYGAGKYPAFYIDIPGIVTNEFMLGRTIKGS